MRKTDNKWKTDKCGRCGKQHKNYSGKLDSNNIQYVVCGNTNKRMNILPINIYDMMYYTVWEKDE